MLLEYNRIGLGALHTLKIGFTSMMKGDEEEVSRRREEEVCKISVDDTYEGVSPNPANLIMSEDQK